MWRIGPKSEHHKLKIFQLFRKTGFPIWNLSWSKTGPTGRALFWSGHCWRHETIFKARAEAKTEGPLGRFRIDIESTPLSWLVIAESRLQTMAFGALGNLAANNANNQVSFFFDRAVRRKSHMRWKIPIYPRWVIPKMNQKWEIELNYLPAPWLSESWESPVSRPLIENLLTKVCQIWVAPMIPCEAAIAQADGLQRAWTSA